MLHVVRAEDWRSAEGYTPQLHLIVDDDNPTSRTWPGDKIRFRFMEWALTNLTFKIIREEGDLWTVRGMEESGLIAHQRMIRPKPKGSKGDHVLNTTRGRVRYDYFRWDQRDVQDAPYERKMVLGPFRFKDTGNVQMGMINLKALLEAAEGMPFAYLGPHHRSIEYTGAMDAVREGEVYKAADYPTWGVNFRWKAYLSAQGQMKCGGYMWPTQEIARQQADLFEATGEMPECWNLPTLRRLFPGHPVIEKIEAQLAAQKV